MSASSTDEPAPWTPPENVLDILQAAPAKAEDWELPEGTRVTVNREAVLAQHGAGYWKREFYNARHDVDAVILGREPTAGKEHRGG